MGLSPFDVTQLLEGKVERVVAESLTLATDGNPLAISEIVKHLSHDQCMGIATLPLHVPIGEQLQEAFSARIEELSPEMQMMLLCGAADPGATRSELEAALAVGQFVDVDYESPCFGGLLETVDFGTVRFVHPLVRSAVYLTASEDDRRKAHKWLTSILPEHELQRRAWHMAAAASVPDEPTAIALELAAKYALTHGDAMAAGEAYERSAEFSARATAGNRLVEAGMAFSRAGAPGRAVGAFDLALAAIDDPLTQADIEMLRAVPLLFANGPARLQETLIELAGSLGSLDPERAANAEGYAALISFSCSRMGDAQDLCRRALDRRPNSTNPVHEMTMMLQHIVDALSGAVSSSRDQLLKCAAAFGQQPIRLDPSGLAFLAQTLACCGEWTPSSRLISVLIDHARAAGDAVSLAHAVAVRSDLSFRTGDWAAALGDSAKGEELARESRQPTLMSYALLMRARVEAGLGRHEEAARRCTEAYHISSELGCFLEAVHSTLGFVELAAGRVEQSIDALKVARDISESEGLRLITAFPWVPELVEAYVRSGSTEDAHSVVQSLDDSPVQGDLPLAIRARCRGIVAGASPDEHFIESLRHHTAVLAPFETARTQLAYGERLRRDGRRNDAIEQLERASYGFARLQAMPWLIRSDRELAACGRIRPTNGGLFQELTFQELQVASAVAGGATNREAAADLFLSRRTVEFHLQQVYRKLGIRSRGELGRRLRVSASGDGT